ncbi:Dematin [Merluccius polli]|uniref:Dematin n=1 Tax=Merluccius polli TaxID=89951 RepID=A0AA47NWJ4_MERPO|nr:Dematin [Merluccius polli]
MCMTDSSSPSAGSLSLSTPRHQDRAGVLSVHPAGLLINSGEEEEEEEEEEMGLGGLGEERRGRLRPARMEEGKEKDERHERARLLSGRAGLGTKFSPVPRGTDGALGDRLYRQCQEPALPPAVLRPWPCLKSAKPKGSPEGQRTLESSFLNNNLGWGNGAGRRLPQGPRTFQANQEYRFSLVMQKVEGRVTPVSFTSSRGPSAPGSPATSITTRVDDEVVGYRDLAAIPRDKAILEVERPDLMTYRPHLSFSSLDPPRRERSLSPTSSPPASPEVQT